MTRIDYMKIKLFFIEQKGSAFLGVLFEFMIIIALIFSFLAIYKPLIEKQKIDYIASKLVRAAEIEGEINSNVALLANELKNQLGINPTITWTANYIGVTNRIQYRDKFSVIVSYTSQIKIMEPSFSNPVYLNVPIQKRLTGISEVFWK